MELKTFARAVALGTTLLLAGGAVPASTLAQAAPAPSGSQAQVLATSAPTATGAVPRAAWSGAIRTSDQAAVNDAYWKSWAPAQTLRTGWGGDLSGCRAGAPSAESRTATLGAINFVRSLGGLAPVSFDPKLDATAQSAALIMSANKALSHAPPSSWRCYSSVGRSSAGKSNLALDPSGLTAGQAVDLYMSEPGAANYVVGHRRWVMNPFAVTMGSGATDTAHALTVIGAKSTSRPNPSWVPWPTKGWFPSTMEPDGRWSLSAGASMDLRYASVRVTRDGTAIKAVKQRVVNGYARPTLVFQVPASLATSGTFKVSVTGIRRAGTSKRYSTSWTTTMFTPQAPAPATQPAP
ncbi:Cysteine-rich secretory protein family protein [Nocardioides scoriae]|uniref:Cysteine-rich secretory protein family protein n=1 Tax=Nocardioides scoriae TaxID=642780 RepID=A0A1H1RCQ1_9ACTN|nr:CAP domain-containing protein [Nocardioides scoriae]SDS33547.1 Cysteine-rich secretory protein family protein [Nocardioides scoriae]